MPITDILGETLPDIPVQLDDRKLKEKHRQVAAELAAFQTRVTTVAKSIDKEVKALERSFDDLVKAYFDAVDAKYGKEADKVAAIYAKKLGRLQKLVTDFDLGV